MQSSERTLFVVIRNIGKVSTYIGRGIKVALGRPWPKLVDNMKMCGLEVVRPDELKSTPTERFLLCGVICRVPVEEKFLCDYIIMVM